MPQAPVNGITIDYRLDGDGPETVVLICGLADTQDSWAFQVAALLELGYRVLTFDPRGAGGSDAPEGPYTTTQLAEDTKALVDQLGITCFHLVGHSMGGAVAQEYALAHSSDLKSVTLSSTFPAPSPYMSRVLTLWADLAQEAGVGLVMRQSMLYSLTPQFFADHPDEAAQAEEAMAEFPMSVEALLAQIQGAEAHDARSRLGALAVPTLVLAADSDILVPPAVSAELHELIPGSRWVTVPGGHVANLERAGEYTAALTDFLGSQPS
ncbi:alpha/beta fold hydrolase [Nocardioides sp. CER19]|uniref:alpha/beta fold hydrolase n=1 Tax=Nocardioides sp. CER19 TaxID=3038538 RepID=UPI002449202E|nr:alpha/beta fold hydrolase [Nocardioides sp. CER19]MDH2416165.1 alpha/beta fold hydrolase [Nocardioides sp. CER19]